MAVTKQEREEAKEFLRDVIKEGDTVSTLVKRLARSGMSRSISTYIVLDDKRVLNISRSVAHALGWRYSEKHSAISVSGCGMDMGFHIINSLDYCLFGTEGENAGYRIKQEWMT